MLTKCLQCGHHFRGKYCPNCGQKANVQRLSVTVILEEVLHFFTHLENGFIFTTKNFLVQPGISSLDFISGKRKNFQKPVSYFLIWIGLYILLHNAIINHFHYQLSREVVQSLNVEEQSNILFRQHLSIFIFPVIMVSAILLYFIMAKPVFNFIELFTLCLYGTGTYFMISTFTDILLGYFFHVNILSLNVFLWQGVLSTLYNLWFTYDVFKRKKLRYFWLRLIFVSFLIFISGWLIMFYLPVLWIYITGQH
jgi:hypothetical protein